MRKFSPVAHNKTSLGNISMACSIGNMSICDNITQDGHTRTNARVIYACLHK